MSKTFTNPGFYHSPYVEFDEEDIHTIEEDIEASSTAFAVICNGATQWVEINYGGVVLCSKNEYSWDEAELESTTFLFPVEFLA